jgi:thiosulfate reductase cytochrome b subunit
VEPAAYFVQLKNLFVNLDSPVSHSFMKKIVIKHPLAIRWFHWINFPVIAIMIWSGLMIYWANDVYAIKIGGRQIIRFFPQSFYEALNLPRHLAEGMAYHFLFMWLFFINGLLYVCYTMFSGEWKYLLPDRKSLKESWQVVLHDLHIQKTVPPQIKYNAAQRIAYTAIVLMGFCSLLTGLAIYKPVQFSWLTWICGGYEAARVEHFALTIGYCVFFIVHVIQVILAGWKNFRSMITGFDVLRVDASIEEKKVIVSTPPSTNG